MLNLGLPSDIFRSLRHRNYRLFFLGQTISVVGTWMQQVAMSWLVYRLSGSAVLLGVVGFASNIAVLFLTPFAGVFLDRHSRYRIVILTQALAALQALILAGLTFAGWIQVWHIVALSVFLGIINAIDIPARQSFVTQIIEDKNDLGNAIAMNSTVFNTARLVGPTLAGILLGFSSEGVCFILNAVSYLAVIAALLRMDINFNGAKDRNTKVLRELSEGFSYTFGFAPTRAILLFLALVSVTSASYTVLMPVFAVNIFHGDSRILGFLMASIGAGALLGAIHLASRKSVLGLSRWIVISSSLFALGLIGFSFSGVLWVSLPLLSLTGYGMMVQYASSNTLIQTIVDEEKRGRVMSFYVLAIAGMAPFGFLLAGGLAGRIGALYTVRIGGFFCLASSFLFSLQLPSIRKLIHPVYVRLGILEEDVSPTLPLRQEASFF